MRRVKDQTDFKVVLYCIIRSNSVNSFSFVKGNPQNTASFFPHALHLSTSAQCFVLSVGSILSLCMANLAGALSKYVTPGI